MPAHHEMVAFQRLQVELSTACQFLFGISFCTSAEFGPTNSKTKLLKSHIPFQKQVVTTIQDAFSTQS
jgi:hypothetical protein